MKNKKIEKTILMFLACAISAYIIPVTNVFAKNQIPTILGVSGNNELTEDINANISLGQSENSLNDYRSNNTLSLNYEDIYNSAEERYKTFAELSIEHAELSTANTLILNFDTDDLVIFTGIDGIENSQIEIVDINITAINAYSNHFALGENVIVNRITVGDENGANVGSVVVLGKANELIVRENSRVLASYSLRLVDDGSTYEWYGDDTSNATQRPEEVSGVAIGAYNGGEISSLVIEDNVTIQTGGLGFLGAVVGAYENSKIGKITIGNYVQIATSYVQMVIGSNSGSTVGDINIGSNINIYCSNAMYAHIGAASGPDEIRKPSSVGIINMRQSTNIYSDQWGANPDHVSNVCIGSERGSYVERIRIAEEWDDIKVIGEPWSAEDVNANNRYSSLWLYTSTNVSIGTYDGIVGSGNGDAIFIGNASIFDNSYAPGALIIGATNNGVINGDIDLSTAALGTQFTGLDSANGDPTVKDSFATAIGSSFGGKVNGVIKLDSFLYASQYNTPPTIIGPNGEGSYVKEVQINDLLTVRTESYEVSRDTVIGSETGQLDKITINGDLYIQMPQKISAEMGHDFIADSIIIKSGNIIGFDAQNKYDSASWYFDGNSKTEVPPWYHDHFRMSVKPKNIYGDSLKSYPIINDKGKEGFIHFNEEPLYVNAGSGKGYEYKYGNDIRTLLSYTGTMSSDQEGALRDSFSTYEVYPIWYWEGMLLDPFVHFAYLPDAGILPVEYYPQQTYSAPIAYNHTTSVKLNTEMSLSEMNTGFEPSIVIYDGQVEVVRIRLNTENADKFLLSNDEAAKNWSVNGRGSNIILNLDNIQELMPNVNYRAVIKDNSLYTKFVQSTSADPKSPISMFENNKNDISWNFIIPSANSGLPDTSNPDSSVPDTSTPEGSKPDTSKPEINSPGTSAPSGTKPSGGSASTGADIFNSSSSSTSKPPVNIPSKTPPAPSDGSTLVPKGNNTYEVIGENGVPLGLWMLNSENVWIFDEYPPLADNPDTGKNKIIPLMAFASLLLGVSALKFMNKK